MTYNLWDKQSPIYQVTAEQAIKNNPLYGSEDSYLFFDDNGSIYDILPISTIRKIVGDNIGDDTSVCEAYIKTLEAAEGSSGGETPSEDITALKQEVEDLKAELAAAKILLGVD